MKKISSIIFLFTISLWAQPQYVTTIYPLKLILAGVIGERGDVFSIVPPGASPHTYELKPSEIKKVESATAIFYGAENLDRWALDLKNADTFSLFNMLPAKNKLAIQDYLATNKNRTLGLDPHFWTDPLTVAAMLPVLADTLCARDPGGCKTYSENAIIFSNHLDSLTKVIQEKLSQAENREVILAHPFFQYFLSRFGFKLMGIIERIPGTEPTPRDLKEIIDLAKKENVRVILTQPQISDRPARLIAEATGAKIVELDPIGGVPGRQTYDELLLYNTQILLRALQ